MGADFALPLVTIAALVQPRDPPGLDATEATTPASSPGAAPRKRMSPGKFFVLPAAGSAAPARPGTGALASHPLNITLSPGSTDVDSPTSSPLSCSPSRFSPFKP